jgi:hypothetical protein
MLRIPGGYAQDSALVFDLMRFSRVMCSRQTLIAIIGSVIACSETEQLDAGRDVPAGPRDSASDAEVGDKAGLQDALVGADIEDAAEDGPDRMSDAKTPELDEWTFEATLKPSASYSWDGFGRTVAIDGDVAAVWQSSAYEEVSPGAPSVYVFEREPRGWRQTARITKGWSITLGPAIAVHGGVLAIGAWDRERGLGLVYIFQHIESEWRELARLSPPGAHRFGSSIAIDRDTLVVSAPGPGPEGILFVYRRAVDSWMFEGALTATGTIQLGETVAVSGDTIAAGEQHGTHVFVRKMNHWKQEARIAAPGGRETWAVALSGDTLLVLQQCVIGDGGWGGPREPCTNVVQIHRRSGSSWNPEALLEGEPGAAFGCGVALAGEIALVHSCETFAPAAPQSTITIFEREGRTWLKRARFGQARGGSALSPEGNMAIVGDRADDRTDEASPGVAHLLRRRIVHR